MRKKILALLQMLLVHSLFLACQNEAELPLNFVVKDNLGKPLPGAVASVNGRPIGQTDAEGLLNLTVPVAIDSMVRVEVKKASEAYYFAPYFQSLKIGSAPPKSISIDAVLYSVPKLATKDGESSAESDDFSSDSELVSEKSPVEVAPKESVTADTLQTSSPALENPKTDADPVAKQPSVPEVVAEKAPDTGNEVPAVKQSTEQLQLNPTAPPVLAQTSPIVYPKNPGKPTRGSHIFSIIVKSGKKSLSRAQVSWGNPETEDLKKICTTNKRGRCAVRFEPDTSKDKIFVIKKKGYQTRIIPSRLTDKGKLQVNLTAGMTIDIFAVTRRYQFVKGLAGVDISIDGEKVGTTNRYGQFSFPFKGQRDDLIEIGLHAREHSPPVFRTDFIASGDLTLVRQFSPKSPPPVRLALLDLSFAGELDHRPGEGKYGQTNRILEAATKKFVFSQKPFVEFPKALLYKTVNQAGFEMKSLVANGWHQSDLKGKLDAIVVPTLVTSGDKEALELAVIGSGGKTMASVASELAEVDDEATIVENMSRLAAQLSDGFPFEGSVKSVSGKNVLINIGRRDERRLKPENQVNIYGLQVSERGQKQTFGIVASGKIVDVKDAVSNVRLTYQKPRSIIVGGDIVVLDRQMISSAPESYRTSRKSRNITFKVAEQVGKVGIGHANVYWNGAWLGSTSPKGTLVASSGNIQGSGILKIIKYGFQPFQQKRSKLKPSERILLERTSSYLRVHSEPPNAKVYVDGKQIGQTPLSSSISVPSGFIKLELKGVPGYKVYSEVLELEQGTLELVGQRRIALEKDLFSMAQQELSRGDVERALRLLETVKENHSDYLLSQHQLGEIYLTMVDDPVRAAEAFQRVTKAEAVRTFQDKRFIGSHINEAMAIFLIADSVASKSQAIAQAHYGKAIEIFNRVEPFLRFVPASQHEIATHNLQFHRALAYQKLYALSQDNLSLHRAYEKWQEFLSLSGEDNPSSVFKQYQEHAQVYMKQARAILHASKEKI